jgi:hypothetical protein
MRRIKVLWLETGMLASAELSDQRLDYLPLEQGLLQMAIVKHLHIVLHYTYMLCVCLIF